MSEMKINDTTLAGRLKGFYRSEIQGEESGRNQEGTWSNASTTDYMTRGASTGALAGAAIGFVADRMESSKGAVTVTTKVPVMESKVLGEIPSAHVSSRPDIPDPAFVLDNGKPVPGKGVKVEGTVPGRNILGQFEYKETQSTVELPGHGMAYNVLGGAVIGAIGGMIGGLAVKLIHDIITPPVPEAAWQGPQLPTWTPPGVPEQPVAGVKGAWSQSAPAWDNSHNRAPWDNTHTRSHGNYSDTHNRAHGNYSDTHNRAHSNYSDAHQRTHSNYSDVHSRSHSNYSDVHHRSHSNYSDVHSRSHSNYSNAHSKAPSWDRKVTF